MSQREKVLGVIAGSVLDHGKGAFFARQGKGDEVISTPYGEVPVRRGQVDGTTVVLVSRHGKGHVVLPSEVDYRAQMWALKVSGATHAVGICAVGSLRPDIKPGDLVVPNQFIDHTWGREGTFFGNGIVGHVSFANPVCPVLSPSLCHHGLLAAGKESGRQVLADGTLVVINGPRFSTRAESLTLRAQGADIIGMTALPEAALAREAEICYASLAIVTDYDCGVDGGEAVTAEMVSTRLKCSGQVARNVILRLAQDLPQRRCECRRALDAAIMTAPDVLTEWHWQDPVFAGYFRRRGR